MKYRLTEIRYSQFFRRHFILRLYGPQSAELGQLILEEIAVGVRFSATVSVELQGGLSFLKHKHLSYWILHWFRLQTLCCSLLHCFRMNQTGFLCPQQHIDSRRFMKPVERFCLIYTVLRHTACAQLYRGIIWPKLLLLIVFFSTDK